MHQKPLYINLKIKSSSKLNENIQNKYTNIKLNDLDENELSL